jgi:hypothetical protein
VYDNFSEKSSALRDASGELPKSANSIQCTLIVKIKVVQVLPIICSSSITSIEDSLISEMLRKEYQMLDAKTLNDILQCVKASYRVKTKMLLDEDSTKLDKSLETSQNRRCYTEHLIKLPCISLLSTPPSN